MIGCRGAAQTPALCESQPTADAAQTGEQLLPVLVDRASKSIADEWHTAPDNAARREMLAEFGVRVTLSPRGAEKRVQIDGGVNIDGQAE